MTQLRITIVATIRGHAPDLKAYAKHLHGDIEKAIGDKDGPDLDVVEIEIARKLEGYESLTPPARSPQVTD